MIIMVTCYSRDGNYIEGNIRASRPTCQPIHKLNQDLDCHGKCLHSAVRVEFGEIFDLGSDVLRAMLQKELFSSLLPLV